MDIERLNIYQLSEEREKQLWESATIVFDSSSLLDFYLYPFKHQDTIIRETFEKLQGRLWLPNHVEFEYLKNRESSILKLVPEKYNPLIKEFNEIKEPLEKVVKKIKELKDRTKKDDNHPHLEGIFFDKLINNLNDLVNEKNVIDGKLKKVITEIEKDLKKLLSEDKVLDAINKYFQIGEEYSYQKVMEIVSEGKLRYEFDIPPGYEDSRGQNKKQGTQIFGDLIIWKQIINYATKTKNNIILICNDLKNDWCHIDKNSKRIINPREELIKEIKDEAGVEFWMYNMSQFLYESKKYLQANIEEGDIMDISEVNFVQEVLNLDPEKAVTLGKENIEADFQYSITPLSRLFLLVRTSEEDQGYVVYLRVRTDQDDYKWLAFGNVKTINNVFESERVFRIGYPDKLNYTVNENVIDKIKESGLKFKGVPNRVDRIRYRSDKDNDKTISFYYKIVD